MAAITIRPATVDDADAISALTCTLTIRHIAPDCSANGARILLASMAPAATAARLHAGYRGWVATDVDSVVAVAVLRPPRHLYHLFVAQAWQRRGLARRLWDVARDALLAEGPAAITVNAARTAVAAYERLGFVHVDAEPRHDGVPSYPMRWLPNGRVSGLGSD